MATNPLDLIGRDATLHVDLQSYLMTTEFLGQCLKHPLVFGVPYFPTMAAMYNDKLKQKREQLQRATDKRDWDSYIWLHERPYRFSALYDLECEIPDETFWRLFGMVYTDSENVGQNYEIIGDWLDVPDIPESIMEAGEREILRLLPSRVTVYRGFVPDESIEEPSDWSWTLSPTVADWFANRFDKGGFVVKGTVLKTDIMAIFNRRAEDEVLVWGRDVFNQSKLKPEEVPV